MTELDAKSVMYGTSYGAWWAVAEATDSALMWPMVQDDPRLRALLMILSRTSAALSEGEDFTDARAAIGPESL